MRVYRLIILYLIIILFNWIRFRCIIWFNYTRLIHSIIFIFIILYSIHDIQFDLFDSESF